VKKKIIQEYELMQIINS